MHADGALGVLMAFPAAHHSPGRMFAIYHSASARSAKMGAHANRSRPVMLDSLRSGRRIPFTCREPAHPYPPATRMALSAEPRCRWSRLWRPCRAAISRRRGVALEVPVRQPRDCRAGCGGRRRNARLRLPRAASRVAVAAGLDRTARRRGVRPADHRALCRRWRVGLPLRMRSRGDGKRRASATGPGAFVRRLPERAKRLSG
jgi:hypothetical protein